MLLFSEWSDHQLQLIANSTSVPNLQMDCRVLWDSLVHIREEIYVWVRLGIKCVENKIQRARSRWFGHFERKEENYWVKKCTRMNLTGVVGRGVPRKMWRSCVKRDMKAMGIKKEMAQDRCAWRNITGGPTRASVDAWHTMCVWDHGCYKQMLMMRMIPSRHTILAAHSRQIEACPWDVPVSPILGSCSSRWCQQEHAGKEFLSQKQHCSIFSWIYNYLKMTIREESCKCP